MDQFVVVDEKDMLPHIDKAIRKGLVIAFPDNIDVYSRERGWHGSYPEYSVHLAFGGEVIAYAGVVVRAVRVGDQPVRIAGVQNVFVSPEHRGTGISRALLAECMREGKTRRLDAGMLFCVPGLEKMYASYGWLTLENRHIVRVEDGEEKLLPEKNIAMVYPLAMRSFPAGDIHLEGNDW